MEVFLDPLLPGPDVREQLHGKIEAPIGEKINRVHCTQLQAPLRGLRNAAEDCITRRADQALLGWLPSDRGAMAGTLAASRR